MLRCKNIAVHICVITNHLPTKIYILSYNSDLFWNHTWQSAPWRPLHTKNTEVILSVFVYRLFHEDFYLHSSGPDEQREIFIKQLVDKHR